jgi:hypothetical protein
MVLDKSQAPRLSPIVPASGSARVAWLPFVTTDERPPSISGTQPINAPHGGAGSAGGLG